MGKLPKGIVGQNLRREASVAKLLKISKPEVLREKRNRNGLEGIPRASWRIDSANSSKKDIILFPHIEDCVDLAAKAAFLAKRDRGENPVIAILGNTYYSLNYCYERNEKGISFWEGDDGTLDLTMWSYPSLLIQSVSLGNH
ncbi:hypothetical protein CR513_11728, partial [Mucuna pruriens]